ncbi:hypothetical protein A8709_32485 [Paenibacillus pectinilyticus]|uniref:AAA+ ATPase domain-containing protein n=1 Tax=Paenibacillus pectinilyticus TaxID=512399 RepID=A0A1C0ZWQ1_9BACL|nr:TniB family NTP-binding protein [Paenibacillus pectinilyticus]OCT12541.1 hypothetical protein A8709_32485 [Paenibacillus pectinilyticus]
MEENESGLKSFQERVLNMYVEHPEVVRIWKRLDRNRWLKRMGSESDDSPIHLFIEGKPGAGKTQLMLKYLRRNPIVTKIDEVGTEIDTRPVLYMKLPVPFTYKGFYNNILKSIDPDFPVSQQDVDTVKNQAFSLMKALGVEMLGIDEMDYLLASTFVQRRAVMENIKDIANSAGVCLVCIGTFEIEQLRTLNTQHLRRYPKTVLSPFTSCNSSFLSFLGELEQQLELPSEFALNWSNPEGAFAPFLFELTRGLVGWIKPIIIEAFELIGAMEDGFSDFSKLQLIDGDILDQAQKNVIGEFADEDIKKILEG